MLFRSQLLLRHGETNTSRHVPVTENLRAGDGFTRKLRGITLGFSCTEGDIGIFGFTVLAIFWIGFSVFTPKDFGFSVSVLVFIAVYFSLISIWLSVFIKNTSGFSVLVFGIFYFVLFGFRTLFTSSGNRPFARSGHMVQH